MMVLRLLPLRAWLGLGAIGVVLAALWWVYDTHQDAKRAEAAVEALEAEIQARDALDAVLLESRQEESATQEAVRALPRRELTVDEESIARRIFP